MHLQEGKKSLNNKIFFERRPEKEEERWTQMPNSLFDHEEKSLTDSLLYILSLVNTIWNVLSQKKWEKRKNERR